MCVGWYGDVAEFIHGFIGTWRNRYQRFLPADIKHYLSCIAERSIQYSFEPATPYSPWLC
jgi:hypothetical protein